MQLYSAERRTLQTLASGAEAQLIIESKTLMGFQIHLVEQWLCDRSRRFKCVTVYTNNQNHLLKVTLIKFNQHHLTENSDIRSAIEEFRSARLFSVGEGQIYIYSLATLPVHLNLVRIDDGDYERHIRNAQLSINLKRLSVCGKTLSMAIPGSDVQNNFYRQYKVTSKFGISICFDLISVVQMSLAVFGFLDISVCDGFVCNSTLAALQNFHDRWAQLDFQVYLSHYRILIVAMQLLLLNYLH